MSYFSFFSKTVRFFHFLASRQSIFHSFTMFKKCWYETFIRKYENLYLIIIKFNYFKDMYMN